MTVETGAEGPLVGAELIEVLGRVTEALQTIKVLNACMPVPLAGEPPDPWVTTEAERLKWFRDRDAESQITHSILTHLAKLEEPLGQLEGAVVNFTGALSSEYSPFAEIQVLKVRVRIDRSLGWPIPDYLIVLATNYETGEGDMSFNLLAPDIVLESPTG